MLIISVFFARLWQETEDLCVVDETSYLKTSSLAFLAIFWHFIDQATNWLFKKLTDRLIDSENNY